VPATAYGDGQLLLYGEADPGRDVIGIDTAGNGGRALVDHAVPDPALVVVVRMRRPEHVAGQAVGQAGGGVAGFGGR
jgi:hypothetical protein